MSRSGGEGRAEVADDSVDLYHQCGVAEPLALGLVTVKRLVVLEGEPSAPRRALRAAVPFHLDLAEGANDAIMVYGTTTEFNPEFEGRIADSVERALLPEDWHVHAVEGSVIAPR